MFNPEKLKKETCKQTTEQLEEGVKIIEISPEKEKFERPVFFAPGWGGEASIPDDALEELAKEGRHVLSMSFDQKIDNDIELPENPLIKETQAVEMQKAITINQILEKKDVEEVDLIAYSEGSINALLAAVMNPEKFKNIILLEPAGMIGKKSAYKTVFDFIKESVSSSKNFLLNDGDKGNLVKLISDVVKHVATSPKLAGQGVEAISKSDIYDMLEYLKSQGMKISIIHGADEQMFPMKDVQDEVSRKSKERGDKLSNTSIDGFYSVEGGHTSILSHPEKYSKLINTALIALENKRQNEVS